VKESVHVFAEVAAIQCVLERHPGMDASGLPQREMCCEFALLLLGKRKGSGVHQVSSSKGIDDKS
jgi:hypothetical protein